MDSSNGTKTSRFRSWITIQNELFQFGNAVGKALEQLPLTERAVVIQEVQRIQNVYRTGEDPHGNPSLMMMRIEHYRMKPGFYEDPENKRDYVFKSYGDVIVAFIASIPISKRVQALNDICTIAFRISGNNFMNMITNKDKIC